MPISLRLVAKYAMVFSKEYMGLKTFAWGEKENVKYKGWGIIGYYEKVCLILGIDSQDFDRIILNGIQGSGYDMNFIEELLCGLSLIPTTVSYTLTDYSHKKDLYIRGMTETAEEDGVDASSKEMVKEVPKSTILFEGKSSLCFFEILHSILPAEVINALENEGALKLVLGNQMNSIFPKYFKALRKIR